jgi:predicted RNase H-like nuclease (RuvC/YqgF family)
MFVKKSKISNVIKKEKQKVRNFCDKYYGKKLESLKKDLNEKHQKVLARTISESKEIIENKEREIKRLQQELDRNYQKYMELRQREKHIDKLSDEIDEVVNDMVIKVQESIQPFYRTRAKVLTTKKRSDRKHDKVESIFRAAR